MKNLLEGLLLLVIYTVFFCVLFGCKSDTPAPQTKTVVMEDTSQVVALNAKIKELKFQLAEADRFAVSLDRNLKLALEKLQEQQGIVINLDDKRCNCELIHQESAEKQVKVYTIRCDSTEKKVFKYYTEN